MVPVLAVLFGGIVGFGLSQVMEHWEEVKSFFKRLITEIKEAFKKASFYIQSAAKIFVRKVKEGYAEFQQEQYYKENEKWFRNTTTVEISENEVPAWAKVNMRNNVRADVTENMEEELEMKIA